MEATMPYQNGQTIYTIQNANTHTLQMKPKTLSQARDDARRNETETPRGKVGRTSPDNVVDMIVNLRPSLTGGICNAMVTIWLRRTYDDPLNVLEQPDTAQCVSGQSYYATKTLQWILRKTSKQIAVRLANDELNTKLGISRTSVLEQNFGDSPTAISNQMGQMVAAASHTFGGYKFTIRDDLIEPHTMGVYCWGPQNAYYFLDPNYGLYFYSSVAQFVADLAALFCSNPPTYNVTRKGQWSLTSTKLDERPQSRKPPTH